MRLPIILAILLAISLPQFVRAGGNVDEWKDLPVTLREKLHYGAVDVPAFPDEDSTLLNVHRWPKLRVFDGIPCRLEFNAMKQDMVRLNLKELDSIEPGWRYGAGYVCPGRHGQPDTNRGPAYYWYSDSTLYERAYHTENGVQDWVYYPGGDLRLAQFHITPGLNRGSQLPGSNEFFDPNGSLVGAYDRSGVFWRGRPVEIREFFAKVREMRKGYRPQD
jgi:hypothetical protein